MKHKLQSSIFLQPIDQHFFANKLQSFPEDESNYFKISENLRFDCLDNSTESDSGESKNEDEFSSESFKSNLRKTSQIAEKSTDEKFCRVFELEKNKFLANENNNNNKYNNNNNNSNFTNKNTNSKSTVSYLVSKQLHSQKNFHVPNFLLLDSKDEQINCDEKNSSNAYSNSFGSKNDLGCESRSSSAKRWFPNGFIKNKSFIEIDNKNNNFLNSNLNIKVHNDNSIKICDNKNNNKNLFGKQENLEIGKIEKTKIYDFLHCDWKSKINAQRFLKFNAYRKKILDSLNNKGQSKKSNNNKNLNSSGNVNKKDTKKNINNNNNCFSNSSRNLNFNQTEIQIQNVNYMNNNNNFLCNEKLYKLNNNSNSNSNQRKDSKNSSNLNLNMNNQQTFVNHIEIINNINNNNNIDNKLPRFDLLPSDPINNYNNFINNSNINNIQNFRKNSAQNFNSNPIANFPLNNNLSNNEINCPDFTMFYVDNRSNKVFPQMNFPYFNDNKNNNNNNNNNYNNYNLNCNFPKTSMHVNYSNNFFNNNNQNFNIKNTFYN